MNRKNTLAFLQWIKSRHLSIFKYPAETELRLEKLHFGLY